MSPTILADAEILTLGLPNKLPSTQFFVCFNFHSDSMLLKVCENVVCVSNSFDPDETPSYSASHPDQSCLHMALWSRLAGKGLIIWAGKGLII